MLFQISDLDADGVSNGIPATRSSSTPFQHHNHCPRPQISSRNHNSLAWKCLGKIHTIQDLSQTNKLSRSAQVNENFEE
jgi:hypothetical protein